MWSLQIEDLWQCWIKQVHRYWFSNSIFSPCVSMSRLGKFHSISEFSPVSCFGICGQWPFMGTLLLSWCNKHRACVRWWTWLINVLCALTPPPSITPVSLSSGSLFIGHNNIELRAIDNPIVAFKCSIKERVNPCGQLSPLLFLRNCHSHPTFATTTLINCSCQHWGKTLRQPKDPQWMLRWCLEIFSDKVFVN